MALFLTVGNQSLAEEITATSGSFSSLSMSSNIGAAEIDEAYSILEELIDTSKDLGKAVARARQNTAKIISLAKRVEYALDAQPSNCSESIGSLSSELQDAVLDLYSIHNEGIKDSGIESLVDDLKGVLEINATSNNIIDVCEYNSPYSSFNPSASVTDQASTKLEELISTSRDLRGIRQARSIVGRIIALANKITHTISEHQPNCAESIDPLLLQLNSASSDLSLINHEGVRDANIGAIMYDLNKILSADLDSNSTIDICEPN